MAPSASASCAKRCVVADTLEAALRATIQRRHRGTSHDMSPGWFCDQGHPPIPAGVTDVYYPPARSFSRLHHL